MTTIGFENAAAEVVDRTIELCSVPAPTFSEGRRAEMLESWWKNKGLAPSIDGRGNVWARIGQGSGPALVVCAHMDTVFADDVSHGARLEGDRLRGPSVGDDTVALAALTVLPDLLPSDGHQTWLLATVAEEGLGNLAGIRHALDHPPTEIGRLIAIEGNYLGRVVTTGVGSLRWRLVFDGPGGHAWEAASQPSAVHELGRVIAGLDSLVGEEWFVGRHSLNVGSVRGGEAVNARAAHAELTLEIRAEDPGMLELMERRVREVAEESSRVEVGFEEIGRRPAGTISESHPLVVAACEALRSVDIEPLIDSASTDANAAFERGIPAITIGVTRGEREHTLEEWISVPPIGTGLAALVRTITNCWREAPWKSE